MTSSSPWPPVASRYDEERDTPVSPYLCPDLLDVCNRAAIRLGIPWPVSAAETLRSRYEGKKLPSAQSSAKQSLPVFPELLEELQRSWERPFSSRSPVPGASSLDCERMESLGLLRLPPMEPLVAAHLHPRSASSSGASLPSKQDRFQSALTAKAYKAAALSARALNVLSLLLAYQAELCEDFGQTRDPATWEEIPIIADLCLCVQCCALQATGREMGTSPGLLVLPRAGTCPPGH